MPNASFSEVELGSRYGTSPIYDARIPNLRLRGTKCVSAEPNVYQAATESAPSSVKYN